MTKRDIQISGFTAQGPRRYQQDAFQIACTTWGAVIGAVADGVGSCARSGAVSRLAVNALVNGLHPNDVQNLSSLGAALAQVVECADQRIHRFREEIDDDPATTLTWFCAADDQLEIQWVGDSPGFLIRGDQIFPLTLDHSLAGDFCRMRGRLVHVGEDAHESNVITRWLGSGDAMADRCRIPLKPGDEVLLCTDGVTKSLHSENLAVALQDLRERGLPFHAWAETIVELAHELGSNDNAAAVLYRHTATPEREPVTDRYRTRLIHTRILRGFAADLPHHP